MNERRLEFLTAQFAHTHVLVIGDFFLDFYLDIEEEEISSIISDYELFQNHPNPFNPSTEIRFNLSRSTFVRLDVFNVVGEKVSNLVSGYMTAGHHTILWDGLCDNGQQAGSGIYFYRLSTTVFTDSKKMILLK